MQILCAIASERHAWLVVIASLICQMAGSQVVNMRFHGAFKHYLCRLLSICVNDLWETFNVPRMYSKEDLVRMRLKRA